MDDRDRLHAYLIIKDLPFCTAEEVANLTGLPKHQMERVLGELVGENRATEFTWGDIPHYRISEFQKEAIAGMATELVVRLRGTPRHGS